MTYGAEFLRWFSEVASRIHGGYADNPVGGSRLLTMKSPVGPCLMITPWNFPLAMGTRGTEKGVQVGPLIDAGAREDISARVQQAVAAGARVVTGGQAVGDRGYFYSPTVVEDVPATARLLTEETFGPVAPIVTFEDEAEGIALANRTEYGLVAYAFTEGLDRRLRVAEADIRLL